MIHQRKGFVKRFLDIRKRSVIPMGFFSSLFRSRASPQNRTAGSGYTFYFGGTTSGKAVTEQSAMQIVAVELVPLLDKKVRKAEVIIFGNPCSAGISVFHVRWRFLKTGQTQN